MIDSAHFFFDKVLRCIILKCATFLHRHYDMLKLTTIDSEEPTNKGLITAQFYTLLISLIVLFCCELSSPGCKAHLTSCHRSRDNKSKSHMHISRTRNNRKKLSFLGRWFTVIENLTSKRYSSDKAMWLSQQTMIDYNNTYRFRVASICRWFAIISKSSNFFSGKCFFCYFSYISYFDDVIDSFDRCSG